MKRIISMAYSQPSASISQVLNSSAPVWVAGLVMKILKREGNKVFQGRGQVKIIRYNIRICDVQIRKVVKYNSFKTLLQDSKMQDKLKNSSRYNGRWTKEEHLSFLQGLRIYGKNWKKIEQLVCTRTGSQIRSHAQKFFLKNKSAEPMNQLDDSPLSGEIQEFPEEITKNSKSMCEGSLRREDLSYYLEKIVQYSSGSCDLNFWEALVDCKGVTDNSIQQSRKNSFISFEEDEESLTDQALEIKKIKV